MTSILDAASDAMLQALGPHHRGTMASFTLKVSRSMDGQVYTSVVYEYNNQYDKHQVLRPTLEECVQAVRTTAPKLLATKE